MEKAVPLCTFRYIYMCLKVKTVTLLSVRGEYDKNFTFYFCLPQKHWYHLMIYTRKTHDGNFYNKFNEKRVWDY